jgi:FkbM family methyltransferase
MACVRDEACQAILNGQLYEPESLEIMSQMSRFGAIVHAGAFFGDFLPTLAKDADPESRIFAFEPNPASYRCAKATIYLNGLEQRIELIRAGLGAEKGTAMLKTVDRSLVPLGGQAHVVDVESADDASPVTCRNDVDSEDGSIEIVTLDEFLPADCRIGVLQLDLEGHETRALQGGLQMIARDRPCLILETPPDQAWFDRHLGALGYRQQRRVHRNTVYGHLEKCRDPVGCR